MSTVKNSILTLFDDNVTGAISAADMRVFVEAIFDSKENTVHVFDKLSELVDYRNDTETVYPIEKFDIICITDANNTAQVTERGVYIALKQSPGESDVFKVADDGYDEFLLTGETGQLISLDSDQKLVWIDQIPGYFIEGTDTIENILAKRPDQQGPVWIASNTDTTVEVPGEEGDGYSWDGDSWTNIGPMRGPEGDVVEVAFASQYEVDAGYSENKAVSPKTLRHSSWINGKEDKLGNPLHNGDMVVSDTTGQRSWETPVRDMGDLHNVDLTGLLPASFLKWNGYLWVPELLDTAFVKEFLDLEDTPDNYLGAGGQVVTVALQADRLVFRNLSIRELTDVADVTPINGQILVWQSGQWVPQDKPTTQAGISQTRPINQPIGTEYFDTTLGRPIWFNGSNWVDALGAIV